MARGRLRAEWERTSWLAATVMSMWSKKPINPRRINPFEPEEDANEVMTDAEWAVFAKG